jgi:chromate transporter
MSTFLVLGLHSFGGPVAHLGYFREELVRRRQWLSEERFADLLALAQFLPGPASSQVAISLGAMRAGMLGGLAAWVGFTLPSAALLVLFSQALPSLEGPVARGVLHGLGIAAVAVVANATLGLGQKLCPDWPRRALALSAAAAVLLVPGVLTQVTAMLVAGCLGWLVLARPRNVDGETGPVARSTSRELFGWRVLAPWALACFAVGLVVVPWLANQGGSPVLQLFDTFFRAGALVFGGGHVVLALLEPEVVGNGWLTVEEFLAGYGAAQAVPGPLFSFSAYVGSVARIGANGGSGGLGGAALALFAIYLPSFLLLTGVLPLWERLRSSSSLRAALLGINAAVVGLLLAALIDPVVLYGIATVVDLVLALLAFEALRRKWLPPWAIVGVLALAGAVKVLVAGSPVLN